MSMEDQLKGFHYVKELADAGIINVPAKFVRPAGPVEESKLRQTDAQVPVIDLNDILKENGRDQIKQQLRNAAEEWGFFQVINHCIPASVLNETIRAVNLFHDQDLEVKKKFYSNDFTKNVSFNFNFTSDNLKYVLWRDILSIVMPDILDPEELPVTCRKETLEYIKHVKKLGDCLFELLSEALGLKRDHLKSLGCNGEYRLAYMYYPACPEPEVTLGIDHHSDAASLAILMQNQVSGLQVLHQHQWVNVQPVPGALVVNIGDYLEILSNGRLKSIPHRVISNRDVARISVACFFYGKSSMAYTPIKELLSEKNPPMYKQVTLSEYVSKFLKAPPAKSTLDYFKL